MSTTVTFAGNLAEAPEMLYARENKAFVSCRVLVNRPMQNDEGSGSTTSPRPTTSRSSAPPPRTCTTAADPAT